MPETTETTVSTETTATLIPDVTPETQPVGETKQGTETTETKQEPEVKDGEQQEQKKDGEAEQKPAETVEERIDRMEREFNERIAKQKEEFENRQKERQAQAEAEKELLPLNMEAVNGRMADLKKQIENAELDGDFAKALDLGEELKAFRANVKEYEKARKSQEEKKQETERQRQIIVQIEKRLTDAQKDIQAAKQIPDELFKKGSDWFDSARRADPTLNKRYQEKVLRLGEYEAVNWAVEYVTEHMGKEAKKDQEQKKEAKGQIPNVSGGVNEVIVAGKAIKTWDELMELPSKEINKFSKENPKAFARIKAAKFK
jgi:DNA repair exonuclease SbcCD ATPase subunit